MKFKLYRLIGIVVVAWGILIVVPGHNPGSYWGGLLIGVSIVWSNQLWNEWMKSRGVKW